MAKLDVIIVKGGSATATLSGLTDLGTGQKVNAPQSVVGTLYSKNAAGAWVAVAGATDLPYARAVADPAGQFKAAIPHSAADTLAVGTQVRMTALVIMPDSRRMPFEAIGSVFPAGQSS